jgi:hypothetical protein
MYSGDRRLLLLRAAGEMMHDPVRHDYSSFRLLYTFGARHG